MDGCEGEALSLAARQAVDQGAEALACEFGFDVQRGHAPDQLLAAVTHLLDGTVVDVAELQVGGLEHEHRFTYRVESITYSTEFGFEDVAFSDIADARHHARTSDRIDGT